MEPEIGERGTGSGKRERGTENGNRGAVTGNGERGTEMASKKLKVCV